MSPDLDTRVRAANPVRDDQLEQLFGDDASTRLLREMRDRRVVPMRTSETDQQFQTPNTTPPKTPRRGWVAAISAAALVIILIGVVAFVQSGDDPPVSSEPTTTAEEAEAVTTVAEAPEPEALAEPEATTATDLVAIGETFMTARDAADAEATLALFADDVLLSSLARTPEEIPLWYAWDEAYGFDIISFECDELATAPTARVLCTYTFTNAWAEALGVGPFDGSSYHLTISEGRITLMVNSFDASEFGSQVWDVITQWLRERHPEDYAVMLYRNTPLFIDESIELWSVHTEEFVAEMTGTASSSDE